MFAQMSGLSTTPRWLLSYECISCADLEEVGELRVRGKSRSYGFLGILVWTPEKSQSYQPAFNVGPSLARQRNAIEMAFRWLADDDPLDFLRTTGPHPN